MDGRQRAFTNENSRFLQLILLILQIGEHNIIPRNFPYHALVKKSDISRNNATLQRKKEVTVTKGRSLDHVGGSGRGGEDGRPGIR